MAPDNSRPAERISNQALASHEKPPDAPSSYRGRRRETVSTRSSAATDAAGGDKPGSSTWPPEVGDPEVGE